MVVGGRVSTNLMLVAIEQMLLVDNTKHNKALKLNQKT
jgi:hypothetical protein